MIDLRLEVTIEFNELIRAVSYMRHLLRGIDIDLGEDCGRCLRSLSEHDNDACHESNQEDHCTYSKRQVARLQQGIFALEEDRRRRAETVRREQTLEWRRCLREERLRNEELTKRNDDCESLLRQMTVRQLASSAGTDEDEIERLRTYFGEEWEAIQMEADE